MKLLAADYVDLPELLPSSFTCKKCYVNRECMMYAGASRSTDTVGVEDSTHRDLLQHFTGHLSREEFDYFTRWDRLIDLEADASDSLISRSWLLDSQQQETKTALCVSSLIFDEHESSPDAIFDESWSSIIGFRRSLTSIISTPLSNVGFEAGCRVVVSTDSTSYVPSSPCSDSRPDMHLVQGVVHKTTYTHIFICASRDELTRIERKSKKCPDTQVHFRIDKANTASGIGTLRQNLVNLFTSDMKSPDESGLQREKSNLPWLRDVLIRLRKPLYDVRLIKSMFNPSHESDIATVPGCDLMDLCFEHSSLNPDQKAAAEQVSV